MPESAKPIARYADTPDLAEILRKTVRDIQVAIRDAPDDTVVDVELKFSRVTVKRGGIPILAPKSTESAMQVTFQTRVRKADLLPEAT